MKKQINFFWKSWIFNFYDDAWIFLYFEKKLIWFFIHSLSISELKEVEHRQNGKHNEECWNVP